MINPWWLLGVLRIWARESLTRLAITLYLQGKDGHRDRR